MLHRPGSRVQRRRGGAHRIGWQTIAVILLCAYFSLTFLFLRKGPESKPQAAPGWESTHHKKLTTKGGEDGEKVAKLEEQVLALKGLLAKYEKLDPHIKVAASDNVSALTEALEKDELPTIKILYPTLGGDPLEEKKTPIVLDARWDPERPLFSVVIAAYNQGKFLEETVLSVLNQEYPYWEIIIVDDGSTDNTFEVASQIVARNPRKAIRVIRKDNGGLADARNTGLQLARGAWLCMLDSDDLLAKDYMLRASELAVEDPKAMIIPGCMRNFDAVESDWCFPEGFSVMGVAHWNKFHASVLINRKLMAQVGGYDPAIPWGLEDWNFWLCALAFQPKVVFIPELTFWYRHHAGSSMRKAMFASHLEETKAMVRTNHPGLFEPDQLMRDHELIMGMSPETAAKLEDKIFRFPSAAKPYFWRGLRSFRSGSVHAAYDDLYMAVQLVPRTHDHVSWQAFYWLGLIKEKFDEQQEALEWINRAAELTYHDAVIRKKWQLETKIDNDLFKYGGLPDGLKVKDILPSYWKSDKETQDIRRGTLAGKLAALAEVDEVLPRTRRERAKLFSLLQLVAREPCLGPKARIGAINLVKNPHFIDSTSWEPFKEGFVFDPRVGRTKGGVGSSIRMDSSDGTLTYGASQVVHVQQKVPGALFVSAWSKALNVSETGDNGYSLYVDILFDDETHEWGFALPFPGGSHEWARATALLERPKAIRRLDLYCLLRGHRGTAWFDDVSVAEARSVICQCPNGSYYDPSPRRDCEHCQPGKSCFVGMVFEPPTSEERYAS